MISKSEQARQGFLAFKAAATENLVSTCRGFFAGPRSGRTESKRMQQGSTLDRFCIGSQFSLLMFSFADSRSTEQL